MLFTSFIIDFIDLEITNPVTTFDRSVHLYECLLNWLRNYAHFDSQDEGLAALSQICTQDHIYFIVDVLNGFEIHRGYWQREEFVSQVDFTILRIQLNEQRDRVIRELGEIQLEELGFSH